MIIILLLWVLLIFCGISWNREKRMPLEIRQAVSLRGICAVEIMIGHIGLVTGSPVLYPNRKAGILFVGIFFLLSGYGVAYGMAHKSEYLRFFPGKKCLRLLLPTYLFYVVYVFLRASVCGEAEWYGAFLSAARFAENVNWYVWEQLALYILLWLVCKIARKQAIKALVVLSVVWIAIAYAMRIDSPWYGSTLCFVLGMYYYETEESVARVFDRHFHSLLLLSGGGLALALGLFFALGYDSILGNPIARNAASLSFCIMILLLLSRITVGNRLSYLLGECSYEIFLAHPFVLALLGKMNLRSQFLYGVLGICCSVAAALTAHRLEGRIRKRFRDRNK